ncbi:UDP-N-acetylglucosamine transferase subunit ALG14 [Entamoeba marina]
MSEWCELNDTNNKKTICVVLGSGGHTSEMLHCITPIDTYNNDYIKQFEFIIAESDAISSQKISRLQSKKNVHTIPRSRSVGQSYFTSIFTTLYALFVCFKMMYIIDADVLLCNGPGTCVPVCIACWLLHLKKVKLIYLESVCRVTTLSLSGKILQHLVDVFVIQWEELKKLVKDAHVHHFFYSID